MISELALASSAFAVIVLVCLNIVSLTFLFSFLKNPWSCHNYELIRVKILTAPIIYILGENSGQVLISPPLNENN